MVTVEASDDNTDEGKGAMKENSLSFLFFFAIGFDAFLERGA